MSVAFLYPLCWLGALAVAAPLWLHLRRRSERPVIRFPTARFLDDHAIADERPMRLRDPLLFALRAAALALLIAAFAWPYVVQRSSGPIRLSRVLVLDNTLSHQADGQFAAARKAAVDAVANAADDTQIAVVEVGRTPRVVVDFADARADAAAKLAAVKPGFERGSYLAAFRQAAALLEMSSGPRRQLELLGDNQENQWTEAEPTQPFLDGVEVQLPALPARSSANLSIAAPELRRSLQGGSPIAELQVQVIRSGDVPAALAIVESNGKVVVERPVVFPSPETSITTLRVAWSADDRQAIRGSVRVRRLAAPPEPTSSLSVIADDDALPLDDTVWFHEPPREEGKVAVVARSPYLLAALSPDVMRGRWLADFSPQVLQSSAVATGDVLLIEARSLLEPRGRELLEQYRRERRGVLLVVDRDSKALVEPLRMLGIESNGEVKESPTDPFRYILYDHPIFQPLRSRDFGDLLDIRVSRYRRLTASDARVLVYSSMGDPLLLEFENGAGRLLVAAFGWERNETNWPIHPSFVPFLDLSLEHLRERATWPRQCEPGERCLWPLADFLDLADAADAAALGTPTKQAGAPGPLSGPVVVTDSTGQEWFRGPLRDDAADFTAPSIPGLYDVSVDGGRSVARTIAVNPSPLEANLTYSSGESKVALWRSASSSDKGQGPSDSRTADVRNRIELSAILRQSTWWWLLAGCAVLLMIETLWASWRGADTAPRRLSPAPLTPSQERAFR
jgi:hypothetical protein